MPQNLSTQRDTTGVGPSTARRNEAMLAAIVAGYKGDEGVARRMLQDDDAGVRASALGAVERIGKIHARDLLGALDDASALVRRRACEVAARYGAAASSPITSALHRLLEDPDPLVVEAACWALGEHRDATSVTALSALARTHLDPRCRESAIASLGAIGDPRGLDTVIEGLADKPAIRRRAVVALAGFDSSDADDAIRRSLDDRDWQVRQSAEILSGD